jgi:hypothetical protein
MKKQDLFKKTIIKNRKLLLSKGFLPSTLTMWGRGYRIPRRKQAVDLALALNVELKKIPHWRLEVK